jgi:hypothetical protein
MVVWNLLLKIWDALKAGLGLLVPVFSRARDHRGWGPGLRWTVRLVLLAGVLAGLWYINNRVLDPHRFLAFGPPALHPFWLPILFVLFVLLSWLGWWLWQLLTPEPEGSDFPDIDAAWDDARAALNQAGIDLTEVPLFLILGRPAAPEEALIQAAQIPLTVKLAPRDPEAPLHVYGNRDGIYVICPGASLLGKQAALLAGDGDDPSPETTPAPGYQADDGDDPMNKTIAKEDVLKTVGKASPLPEIHAIMTRAREADRDPNPAERQRMRALSRKARPALMKNAAEVERLSARLGHLCRRIGRDRRPFCPANGILVLVPLAATDTEDDANQTGLACRRDLATARQALRVHCPTLALVCDLETAPGFGEFFDRFPEKQRQRRVGQRFPLVPAAEPAALPAMIDGGVKWICQALFPTWVYKFFRVEGPGREDAVEATRGNVQLYRLMNEMRERQRNLSRILTRGLLGEADGPPLLGGCYVAATGRDPDREQAFAAGVFRRLLDEQNFVSWTAQALAEDADQERWTRIGYAVTGVFAALVVGLIFLFRKTT